MAGEAPPIRVIKALVEGKRLAGTLASGSV